MKKEKFCKLVRTVAEADRIATQKNDRLYLIESNDNLYLDADDFIRPDFEKLVKVYEPKFKFNK